MNLVQQIKQSISIIELVVKHTNGLRMSGKFLTGDCPFCGSRRKFWVNPYLGICGCHKPKCQAAAPGQRPMDVINFYSRIHKLSNFEAIRELAIELGLWQESAASHVRT